MVVQWEQVDLPQAEKGQDTAEALLADQQPILDASEQAYKKAFDNAIESIDLQEEAKVNLFNAQNAAAEE